MAKILLVEDDRALSTGLIYSMEKEGYTVIPAESVKSATSLFSGGGFDLAVLDIGLPDGTGFDLCREIRDVSDVPILFLTACDEETNVVMGLEMGGDEYITKPFRLRELLSRIKALLRRAGKTGGIKIRSRGFILDCEQSRLYKNGREVPLTPAEYRLTAILMSNRNITLTREKLLGRLWDSQGEFVDENALTVYIRRIREKIEENPSSPAIIITVRGTGYKWADAAAENSHSNSL